MHSPPKAFGTPQKKRHKSNNYNRYQHNWTATENPSISYSSPISRKRNERNTQNIYNSNDNYDDITSSPISTRYQHRINTVGTSLYDDNNNNNNSISNHLNIPSSPLRSPISRKRKFGVGSSPISPTFQPISHHSPSSINRNRQNIEIINGNNNSCDRYTPNHGNINRYDLHSPTKRFLHNNNNNMMSYTNIIAPSPKKRRKLGQNYSGTNDDPSSLNHRIKQKLSQHTYNQVLQSELLGFSAEHTNIVNQVFNQNDNNDDTEKNDNISNIQMEPNQTNIDNLDSSNNNNNNNNNNNINNNNDQQTIFGSPSLPNRRIRNKNNNNNNNKKDEDKNAKNEKKQLSSHHPLCPCYNNNNNNELISNRNDEHSLNSEESERIIDDNENTMLCVCDSITSNVATNFLVSPQRTLRYDNNQENIDENNNEFGMNMTMTPIKPSSQSQLSGSRKSMRNIAKSPFKVLDAPRLTDDFYLNLVDWSASCNVLSVGLGECVYLWSAMTSKVSKLTDLTKLFEDNEELLDNDDYQDGYDMVCSVGWSKNHQSALNNCIIGGSPQYGTGTEQQSQYQQFSDYLGVGSGSGFVFIFDTIKTKLVRSPLYKHNHRVGVISWMDNNILSTGSRDRNIFIRDIRINDGHSDITQELIFHKQEVCGLKWSEDSLYLASGGNDNKLAIWDIRNSNKPICYGKHKAAVKAITWSPHDAGLIASGGGTADRCIKFWNINNIISSSSKATTTTTRSGTTSILSPIEVIDTGSQVCNLLWSKNVNEIVSTHGYSLNQIVVWKYPTMDKIVTLTGHTYRVLYLSGSPDGQTVVTGAGDETLRLWNIFPPINQNGNDSQNFVPKPYSIPLHIR